MKFLAVLNAFFFMVILSGFAQTNPGTNADSTQFEFSFTTFNHAELLMEGVTTYRLTDTSLTVKNTSLGQEVAKVLFHKRLLVTLKREKIGVLKLDTLQKRYFNHCVLATSGNEYALSFTDGKFNKRVTLHAYYLEQVDEIVRFINENLPKEFRVNYETKDRKQDCKR